ncbi:MAG: hypothetical protein Q9212_002699 [Teloschistes hypoglaucus]
MPTPLKYLVAAKSSGAPETYRTTALERSRLQVPQSADVFSIGCILSEVVTWVTEGSLQLREYRRRRSEEAYSTSQHTKEALFHSNNSILDTVNHIHEQTLLNRRENDYVTSDVIRRLIKGMLITDVHARAHASYFLATGSSILVEARKALTSREHTPSPVHAASDGIVTVGKRRLPPNLPPDHHHRPLDPIRVVSENPGLDDATARRSSSRSRGQVSPEVLPGHSMARSPNEEPTESLGNRWEPLSARDVEGTYPMPDFLVRRQDRSMTQPVVSSGPASQHRGRSAAAQNTSILAQRSSLIMRPGNDHILNHGYNPTTFDVAEEPNGVTPWHLNREPTVTRTSQSSHARSSDPYLANGTAASGLEFDSSLPIVDARSSNEPTQNVQLQPYMSVDEGLSVKRERDGGKDSKYPGWDAMKTMDYLLRGRDHALLIDNAESMREHREKARKVTELLASLTEPYDPNGLDLYFTTDAKNYKPKGNRKVLKLFDEHPPKGLADIGHVSHQSSNHTRNSSARGTP